MKAFTTIFIALVIQISASAQTKVYFSAGRSVSNIIVISDFYVFGTGLQVYQTENSYNTKGISDFWTGELLVESRLNKVVNGVTGISIFQMGYDNARIFDDATVGNFIVSWMSLASVSPFCLGPT
ncbi:MAG: hypothetical protein GY816_09135 [Cytophagales bacterium]|nr:hypothetical protein [Cytophagales bacterium]